MTLLEMSVVIMVLLLLIAVLFVGANGWKNGTDRARCILQIRQMQMSVRGYAATRGVRPGTDLALESPPISLLGELVGPGKFVPELPTCPGSGLYFFRDSVVPETGSLYMTCSLADSLDHVPGSYGDW